MAVYTSIDQLIGNTPLLELSNIEKNLDLKAKVLVKLEYFNPAGSVKDRIAKAMLDDAEAAGKLNKDSVIIEPTSGNTGVGLASVAAARGYRLIITMPETMSVERRLLMKAYGAELVLTDGAKISWKRIASATGYQITISTDKKFKKNVKNYIVEENKNNELIYGLKSGKTYYVKVRAIAQGGGKKVTGKYSKAVKFTTYVVPKVKKISVKNNKKGTITITASKVKGAAGYAFVVTADSGLTDIVAIKESKKNTVTIKNLSKGHTYYIRACAYKLNKQKQKVFGVYTKKAKITIKK